MFVYNFKDNKLPDISNLQTNLDTELFVLKNQIDIANKKEETIYKKFINLSVQSCLNFENASILNDFNNAFSSSSEILEKLNSQKNKLDSIKDYVSGIDFENDFNQQDFLSNLQELLEDYYDNKNTTQKLFVEENTQLDELISILDKNNASLNNDSLNKKDTPPLNKNNASFKKFDIPKGKNEPKKSKFIPFENINKTKKEKNNKPNQLSDNRLLFISEKNQKVYLPYYATDLQQILLKSDYETCDEFIENEYIFPLKKYKNPLVSRFKESYRLMREREYESFAKSFSFAIKTMNNYKLHPAVITACRNIDELKCFLGCLEEDSVDSFDIFDIKFDAPPIKR